ncbi:MAG: hypothetical protein AB7T03_06410 [Bacilli bacterium]
MKKGLTEMVFILDRSGSMKNLEKQTIDSFNEMIAKQKNVVGEAVISTVLFDHEILLFHNRIDLKEILPLTCEHYFARGTTALYDAIGKTISRISRYQENLFDNEKPEKTIVVIITDGMENASSEYRLPTIKRMIEVQKSQNSWEFLFLGANIDAVETARSFGISGNYAADYQPDAYGTSASYCAVEDAIRSYREDKVINPNWKDKLKDDSMKKKERNK